jgi:hypothetical protein
VTQPDALVRIALAAMAADETSRLTADDRKWIRALPFPPRTPLTVQERARWKDQLLAWIRTTVPGAVEIITNQFPHEEGSMKGAL